jgi:hypothetical protein
MVVNNDNSRSRSPGCSTALKGCLIVTALVMGLFIAGLLYFARLPSVQAMRICSSHMQEVASAVSRYEDVNGHRPSDLRALAKQYLSDPSVLRCPLDKSPGDAPSYAYNPRAKDDQIMLECDRHKLKRGMPNSKLRVLGNGKFEIESPGFREAWKEAEKRAK